LSHFRHIGKTGNLLVGVGMFGSCVIFLVNMVAIGKVSSLLVVVGMFGKVGCG